MRLKLALIFVFCLPLTLSIGPLPNAQMLSRFTKTAEGIQRTLGRGGIFLMILHHMNELERNGRDISHIDQLLNELEYTDEGHGGRSYKLILRHIFSALVLDGARL